MSEIITLSQAKTVEEINIRIDYLFGKVNWGASSLDAKAIEIMNSLKSDISSLVIHTDIQPMVEENFIVHYTLRGNKDDVFKCGVSSTSEEKAKEKFCELFVGNQQIDEIVDVKREKKFSGEKEDFVVQFKMEQHKDDVILHFLANDSVNEEEAEQKILSKYSDMIIEIVGVKKFTDDYFTKFSKNLKRK